MLYVHASPEGLATLCWAADCYAAKPKRMHIFLVQHHALKQTALRNKAVQVCILQYQVCASVHTRKGQGGYRVARIGRSTAPVYRLGTVESCSVHLHMGPVRRSSTSAALDEHKPDLGHPCIFFYRVWDPGWGAHLGPHGTISAGESAIARSAPEQTHVTIEAWEAFLAKFQDVTLCRVLSPRVEAGCHNEGL